MPPNQKEAASKDMLNNTDDKDHEDEVYEKKHEAPSAMKLYNGILLGYT